MTHSAACAPEVCFSRSRYTGKERDTESGNDYFGARYYSSAMGRWMSPDRAGPNPSNPQALNLYRYGFNNPLRYTDPDGFYEQDVHNDLTRLLSYAAGYSWSQATAIGEADQDVDSPARSAWHSVSNRRKYHFTTEGRRDQLWILALSSGDIYDFGTYLHAEQDSYAHAGFGPLFGHFFAGHFPDKTYTNPGKADTMAKDTYSALLQAGVQIGTEAGPVPLAEIMPFVQAFNRAKTVEDKNKQLDLIKQTVDQYRQDHKDDKEQTPPSMKVNPGYCSAEFSHC